MEGTYSDLTTTADKLIKILKPLADNHHQPNGNWFLAVMEGIYRRNYLGLIAIRYLANNKIFGDKALDLSRAMIEDTVSVEYMIAFGKRRLARKFRRFFAVQVHQDAEFMTKLKQDPQKVLPGIDLKQVERDYKKVKAEFTHSSGTDMHSWVGKTVDKMLLELKGLMESGKKRLKLTNHDIELTSVGYIHGNRKNHLNPLGTLPFMMSEDLKHDSEQSMREALVFSLTCIIRLSTRYIDEIRQTRKENVYADIGEQIKEVFKQMDSVPLPTQPMRSMVSII